MVVNFVEGSFRYNEAKQLYSQAITVARQNGIKDDLAQSLQNRAACNEQLVITFLLLDERLLRNTLIRAYDHFYLETLRRRSR